MRAFSREDLARVVASFSIMSRYVVVYRLRFGIFVTNEFVRTTCAGRILKDALCNRQIWGVGPAITVISFGTLPRTNCPITSPKTSIRKPPQSELCMRAQAICNTACNASFFPLGCHVIALDPESAVLAATSTTKSEWPDVCPLEVPAGSQAAEVRQAYKSPLSEQPRLPLCLWARGVRRLEGCPSSSCSSCYWTCQRCRW